MSLVNVITSTYLLGEIERIVCLYVHTIRRDAGVERRRSEQLVNRVVLLH